jgi:predicted DNA-binding transcriptional regulator YafY
MSCFLRNHGDVRADRLLSILLLLQRHGKLPAADLAGRLEVSTRTIYRDVEALSAAGVPVYAERGRNGGVSLVPGYRTDLTGLTAGEAQALFLFSGNTPVEQLGRGGDLRQAIRKLLAAVPGDQRDEVERVSGRVVVDPESWRRGPEPVVHLTALQDAVLHDRPVTIRYPSRSAGVERDYDLDPYGLVAKAGVWYLLAGAADGTRTFRVSRVRAVTVRPGTFARPDGLDVERLWGESSRAFTAPLFDEVDVTVRIEPDAVPVVQRVLGDSLVGGITGPDAGDADRRPAAVVHFVSPRHAVASLVRFGAGLEVTAPDAVRRILVDQVAEMAALYGM